MRIRAMLAVLAATPALTLGTGIATATTVPVAAGPPGPFVTLLFSRSEVTAADNCVADSTNIARLDTTVAPYLYSRGIHGTGSLVTDKTEADQFRCVHRKSSESASWSQAANLGSAYGWSFVSHTATYPVGNLSALTPAQAYAETCGSAKTIDEHGLQGGHGLIAYPGTDKGQQWIQERYSARCFAWGRHWGSNGVTKQAAGTTAPYWQHTIAVNGGSCNDPTAPCYRVHGATSRYTDPASIIATIDALRPGQWLTIQAYVLVTRTNPQYNSSPIRWDCTSSSPELHWTNDNERYCWSDYQTIINAVVSRNIQTADPLQVGIAFGRPATYP
jgi:hypothetical protein